MHRLRDLGRYEPAIGRVYRRAARGALEARREEADAIRESRRGQLPAERRNLVKDAVSPRRYLAIRIRPRQGELLRDGTGAALLQSSPTAPIPRCSDLDLIRWHRQKAGTIEHAHDVLMNELAGAALPSQKFGANAAWLRLNAIFYNLRSAYKRVGLPRSSTPLDPTAALPAPQLGRQDRPPCPRHLPALHRTDRSNPRRPAAHAELRPRARRLSPAFEVSSRRLSGWQRRRTP